jgi:ArsR family transcriptional regulator, arsenate/arsenite/antimonite-responsive transcriptional repressor / arsenate reductase (thioredoxin)
MTDATGDQVSLPPFLQAAAHRLRWQLLGELARSDRQVHELTALVGQPQNLVSYHLRRLRDAELVTVRRSSADGRDAYYHLDLGRCGQLLAAAGGDLHPGLLLAAPAPPTLPARRARLRVLFLCTGNSARSQMAETLMRRTTDGQVDTFSAGSHPKPIHPHAVTVMARYGIDLTSARPKHLDEYSGQRFDHVITLCDKVREICPEFPGGAEPVHWSIADPAAEPDGLHAFTRTAIELTARIAFLRHHIARTGPTEPR